MWRIDILDDAGNVVSSVYDKAGVYPEMCGSARLFVQRNDAGYVHLLDTQTANVTNLRSTLNPGTAFVSCKEDGTVSVANYNGMPGSMSLELFDREGKPSMPIPVVSTGGHRSWEYSESTWSPDGRLLAIWERIRGGGRLSILDSVAKTITDVTPKNWIDTAFGWRNGHKLVIAGHHRDGIDFEVGLLDAIVPNAERQVLQHLSAQTQSIASLPGEMLVEGDVNGVLQITSSSGNETRAEGRHPNLEQLYVTGGLLLSSSYDEVRMWQLNPPTIDCIVRR